MTHFDDLDWLASRQPAVADPDQAATARARAALRAHIDPPRVRRRPRALALAAAAAVAAAVVAALPLGGADRGPLAPHPAQAAPLLKLSATLRDSPPPPGDATLVFHRNVFPDGRSFTGHDLYLDDGRYYYGETSAELVAAARHGDDLSDGGTEKRELEAAVAANTLPPAQARTRMLDATWPGGTPPTAAEQARQAAAAKRILAEKRKAGAKPGKPASAQSIADNRIWIGAMDAITAGVGRTDVRAGVLKLLATMPHVTAAAADQGVLRVTNSDFPDGYAETMFIDARSGTLLRFTGGVPGKTPSVVVTYTVKRVNAADVIAGR